VRTNLVARRLYLYEVADVLIKSKKGLTKYRDDLRRPIDS